MSWLFPLVHTPEALPMPAGVLVGVLSALAVVTLYFWLVRGKAEPKSDAK
jgi:hypothetical protein